MADELAPVRIELSVEGFGDSRTEDYEIDRAEWDAMTVAERNEHIRQVAEDFATNYVNWGWHIADPDDYADTEDGV
ncbi:hypothetical protein ABGB07_36320 [Micromonosporaceae bacterium B7E4]